MRAGTHALPGTGSIAEFLLALVLMFALPATIFLLGSLFDTYVIDIWTEEYE